MNKEDFLKSVQEHVMTIENDCGVHRCLHFGKPGLTDRHFRLITWPGHLAISGDMGDFTFSRSQDMFEFFRDRVICPNYWGEKLTSFSKYGGYEVFDWDYFSSKFTDHILHEHSDLSEDEVKTRISEAMAGIEQDEYGAVELLRNWGRDNEDMEIDDWGALPDGKKPSYQYLWCLHAIVWGISQYDEHKGVGDEPEIGLTTTYLGDAKNCSQACAAKEPV